MVAEFLGRAAQSNLLVTPKAAAIEFVTITDTFVGVDIDAWML